MLDPLDEFRDAFRNELAKRYWERALSKFFGLLGLKRDLGEQASAEKAGETRSGFANLCACLSQRSQEQRGRSWRRRFAALLRR
jgi:hypothetical protein